MNFCGKTVDTGNSPDFVASQVLNASDLQVFQNLASTAGTAAARQRNNIFTGGDNDWHHFYHDLLPSFPSEKNKPNIQLMCTSSAWMIANQGSWSSKGDAKGNEADLHKATQSSAANLENATDVLSGNLQYRTNAKGADDVRLFDPSLVHVVVQRIPRIRTKHVVQSLC